MADQQTPVRERDPGDGTARAAAAKPQTEFRVAERREDGTVVLDLGDGRMTTATVADGVEGIRKGSTVTIKALSYTGDGVPEGAEVIKVA